METDSARVDEDHSHGDGGLMSRPARGPKAGAVMSPAGSEQLRNLLAITDTALARLDVEDFLSELLGRIRAVLDGDTAAVLLRDGGSDVLVARARVCVGGGSRQGPFFDVSGSYELRFTLRPDRVSTFVALRRDGEVAFAAAFWGRPEPATRRAVARLQVRRPLMTQRVSTLIWLHVIWLWLRGLRVHTHQPHIRQTGV
jgi:hypothetical protein